MGATLVGGVVVEPASGILIQDLTLRDGTGTGIRTRAAELTLRRVTVRGQARTGIAILEGSTAVLDSVVSDDNGLDGITAWASSSVDLVGVVQANRNVRCGMIVSSGSGLEATGRGADIGDRLIAEDNGLCGLAVQVAAGAQFGRVSAHRNGLFGVVLVGNATLAGLVEATGNIAGLAVFELSNFEGAVRADGNTASGVSVESGSALSLLVLAGDVSSTANDNGLFGILLNSGAHAVLDRVEARRNGTGMRLDDGSAQLFDTVLLDNGLDADVAFASRVTFLGGNSVGSVACEPTVFVRGGVACPDGASAASSLRAEWSSRPHARLQPPLPFAMEPE